MPAEARGHVRKLPSGKWQLRYYDRKGVRHSGGAFPSKSAAWTHYRDAVEPELRGHPAARRDVTLTELAGVFLERHEKTATPRTIRALRERLKRPLDDFGTTPLVDLERMTDEIAGFASRLSERYRYSVMSAFRQACEAGVRYGYMTKNPAKLSGPNPMPAPRAVRVFTPEELNTIAKELGDRGLWRSDSQRRRGSGQRSGRKSSTVTSTGRVECSLCGGRRHTARGGRFR